ncbi:MAG TPA: GntR family transcriptional regulator [Solimonas sp.]|nr:GntR family transcriptional regulator [Solimonas sp.]
MSLSAFSAIRKQSLSDSVFQQLRHKIVSHELAAGAELPAERELSEMLGVNRGAVREAIKRLQQAGLVAVRQGGNHTVLDYQAEGGLELLPSLLVDAKGNVNPPVARAALSLRAALAPDVAASAASAGGAKLADQLDAVLACMRAAQADTAALQELALDYWSLLVNAGGNIAYRLAFNTMNKTYRKVWGLLTKVMEAEFRDLDNLAELSRAVRRRDAKGARACAEKHVAIGTRALDAVLGRMPAKR